MNNWTSLNSFQQIDGLASCLLNLSRVKQLSISQSVGIKVDITASSTNELTETHSRRSIKDFSTVRSQGERLVSKIKDWDCPLIEMVQSVSDPSGRESLTCTLILWLLMEQGLRSCWKACRNTSGHSNWAHFSGLKWKEVSKPGTLGFFWTLEGYTVKGRVRSFPILF